MKEDLSDLTPLLAGAMGGESRAESRLFEVVHGDLRERAHQLMRHQPAGHSLQTTALVHEAWLKLRVSDSAPPRSRLHFLRVATRAMRSILVDHARMRTSQKRGGALARTPLEDVEVGEAVADETVLHLNDSLDRLRTVDEELALVAELKLFSALSMDEIAEALGTSKRTTARAWSLARAWLQRDLVT